MAIAVYLGAVAEMFPAERSVETGGVIEEKHGTFDIAFLGRLGEKRSGDRDRQATGIGYVGNSRE